jgi:formylglycine-generating enzyme required for sulfatase activity
MMGSPENETDRSGDEPQHQVILTEGFYLGKYQVTQAEYERVMGKKPSHFKGKDHPVETVAWEEAMEFCRKLTQRDRATIPDGFVYTLPTEAQWEYACRAGSEGTYCFGDDENQLDQYAWFGDNSNGRTHPVGQKQPNVWRLHDMHGNVFEWCLDWYGAYPASSQENTMDGSLRVSRGGSWRGRPESLRSADRGRSVPDHRYYSLGFRVAAVPSGKTSQ